MPRIFRRGCRWPPPCRCCGARRCTVRGGRQPPLGWLMLLAMLGISGVHISYGTLLGRDPGVAMLALLLSLKSLEMHGRRDVFVLVFICFFLLLANFFHAQGLLSAAWMLATVMVLLAALLSFHYGPAQPRWPARLRLLGRMLALALPLSALLFFMMPRLAGPLWGGAGPAWARTARRACPTACSRARSRNWPCPTIPSSRAHFTHRAAAAKRAVLARRGAGQLRRRQLDPQRRSRCARQDRYRAGRRTPRLPGRSAAQRPAPHLCAGLAAQHRAPARQPLCGVAGAGSADRPADCHRRALPRQFADPLPAAGAADAAAKTAMAGAAARRQSAQPGLGAAVARAASPRSRRRSPPCSRIFARRRSATPCSHRCWARTASTTSCSAPGPAFANTMRAALSC